MNHEDEPLRTSDWPLPCTTLVLPAGGLVTPLTGFYLFTFRDRERGREGETKGETHGLVASQVTPRGAWPATQACGLTRNGTSGLWVCGTTPRPPSHTSRGHPLS